MSNVIVREILRRLNPKEWTVWVYRRRNAGGWEVGYYDPRAKFHTEPHVHASAKTASERVAYLNGRGKQVSSRFA